MRVGVMVTWFDGLAVSVVSIIRVGHRDITPGSRGETCQNQKGGEANARQVRGADTSGRGEATHLWAEGYLGRGNCDLKCEGRGIGVDLERHESIPMN